MAKSDALSRLVPKSDEAPHRAVIWVSAEVHEVTRHGECSGMPKYRIERFPLYLDGADRHIAVRKLNELLAQLKEQCDPRK